MITYYDVLNVSPLDTTETIYKNYYDAISYYNNPNLTEDQVFQIKFIKMALYVLTNDTLKNKYNYYIYKKKLELNKSVEPENSLKDFKNNNNDLSANNNVSANNDTSSNNVSANNDVQEQTLDTVFNVDNKWMNNNSFSNDDGKLDNKIISNRVFDLTNIYDRKINYDELKIEPHRGATREGKQNNILKN